MLGVGRLKLGLRLFKQRQWDTRPATNYKEAHINTYARTYTCITYIHLYINDIYIYVHMHLCTYVHKYDIYIYTHINMLPAGDAQRVYISRLVQGSRILSLQHLPTQPSWILSPDCKALRISYWEHKYGNSILILKGVWYASP